MSEPTHVIRYEITAQGAIDASRTAQARLLTGYRLACLVAIGVGGILAATVGLQLGLTIAVIAFLLLATTATTALDRMLVRRNARSVLGGTTELALDAEGITFTTPLSSGRMPWSSLTTVRASDTSIVWMRDRLFLAWAPTTAVGAPEDVAAVVAFSRERIAAVPR